MREGHRTVSRVVSIKRRLTAIIMGTSVVALVLASTAFLVYDRRTSRKAMLQSQSALAEFIGTQSTAALTFRYRQKAQEILAGLSVQQNLLLACLYTKESWEFARYAPAGGAGPCPKQPESDFHRFQDDALTLSKPVMLDGESIGVARNWPFLRAAAMNFSGSKERQTPPPYIRVAFIVVM
ncbi:MAG: hypothetical protein COB53_12570 [Elusimicrobia bacterium]|nr:MAG: hypothetical protein COB53_12570 [Elusimicrobiota bacterium]